jgi:hypothetical protein
MGDQECLTMTVPEAGKYFLGLSKNASYDAAKRGEIPVVKVAAARAGVFDAPQAGAGRHRTAGRGRGAMSEFTNLEDANSLKRMGLPLNMPVEHRKFARESSKHWLAL